MDPNGASRKNLAKRRKIRYTCKFCSYSGYTNKAANTHFQQNHVCQLCFICTDDLPNHIFHKQTGHGKIVKKTEQLNSDWKIINSKHLGFLRSYKITNKKPNVFEIAQFFIDNMNNFRILFMHLLQEITTIKAQISVHCILHKVGTKISIPVYLNGFFTIINSIELLENFLFVQASNIIITYYLYIIIHTPSWARIGR